MSVLDYMFFCRPMLLIPVWTFYLLFDNHLYDSTILSSESVFCLFAMTAITAGAYVINQLYDEESDRLNQKLGFFDSPAFIQRRNAWILYLLLTATPILVSIVFLQALAAPLLISFLFGWAYSAPPVKGKDKPLSGWLFNAIPFSALIWWGVAISNTGGRVSDSVLDANSVFSVACVFSAVSATYILTTISDREGDRSAGKRTIGARLGLRRASYLSAGFAFLALALAFVAGFWEVAFTAMVATALATVAAVRKREGIVLLATKAPIAILTLAAVYHFPLYGAFLLALILITRLYYRRRFNMIYPQLQ